MFHAIPPSGDLELETLHPSVFIAEAKRLYGAKHLIGEHADAVCEVPMPDDASLRDIDTPEELATRRGV
jgi:hypothetical protein